MNFWTPIMSVTAPARGWLRRRWAPTAATAAVIATILGVVTDLDTLLTGGSSLTQAEAAALAGEVAMQLEQSSVARGGDYGNNTDLEGALETLARSGDRRVERALSNLEAGEAATAFDLLAQSAERLVRRDPVLAAQRYYHLGVLAEAVDPDRSVAA